MTNELFLKQLMQVIKDKMPIEFPYQGKARLVAPTLLAKNKDDRLFLQGLQFGGDTSKGPCTAPEWRLFYLDELPGFKTVQAPWPTVLAKSDAGPYKPPKFVKEILALTPGVEISG